MTVAYVDGGLAAPTVVSVVGNAISISFESGVTDADAIKVAFDLVPAAVALATLTVSGTGSDPQTAPVAAAPLAGGVDSGVDVTGNELTSAAHGMATGRVVRVTTGGTLPAPLLVATDYYVISTGTNTFKLASSLVNAQAGTAIDLTTQGSSGATFAFTPTALAGATYTLEYTNNTSQNPLETKQADPLFTAVAITLTGTDARAYIECAAQFVRVAIGLTAGQLEGVNVWLSHKGF